MTILSNLRSVAMTLTCVAGLGAIGAAQSQTSFHARGHSGVRGTAVSGAMTTSANGTTVRNSGRAAYGAAGGNYVSRRTVTSSADGSATASHYVSGSSAAGNSITSSGAYSRSSSGAVTGSASTTLHGANGGYVTGNTSTANGVTTHTTSGTNAAGESYNGQTTYTQGQGVSHTSTCKDANGNVIEC